MRTRISRALPWLQGLPGVAAGLFLARVTLEVTHRPWPGTLVVAVAVLAAALGFFLGRRLTSRLQLFVIGHLSFVILLIYVFWPRRDLLAAASVALLAVLVWGLSGKQPNLSRRIEPWTDLAIFAVALAIYWATLARDVIPADAGEFQLAAALLGVPHPPGYPLYTLIGHLFIRLIPWATRPTG
jgi:hypothetical protein